MFNKTNEELKSAHYNRANRRIILGINKTKQDEVKQALHHRIPSWREAMIRMVTNV